LHGKMGVRRGRKVLSRRARGSAKFPHHLKECLKEKSRGEHEHGSGRFHSQGEEKGGGKKRSRPRTCKKAFFLASRRRCLRAGGIALHASPYNRKGKKGEGKQTRFVGQLRHRGDSKGYPSAGLKLFRRATVAKPVGVWGTRIPMPGKL